MTGEQLQDLIATLAVRQAEQLERTQQIVRTSVEELRAPFEEVRLSLKDLRSSLKDLGKETDRRMKETDQRMKETDQRMKETDRQQKQTDKQLKELGKQIGGLGDKFGSFTEGLALPSMKKILKDRFRTDFVATYVERRQNGHMIELDVLAYSNGDRQEAYVVEVKSHLRLDSIEQMKKTLREFRAFFPEHSDKKAYGILAAVHIPARIREKVLQEGLYLAHIHDGQFELQVPDEFQPRAF